jgi:hypothetical protein
MTKKLQIGNNVFEYGNTKDAVGGCMLKVADEKSCNDQMFNIVW